MNFFGHAVLASHESAEPAFVLGAMLPDFATMISARPPEAAHVGITAGIAYHHLTDQVFHDAPLFRRLCNDAFVELQTLGVRRGSARAVAHVGIELLLDGVLAAEKRARSAYQSAIEHSAEASLGTYVLWPSVEVRERFAVLRAALERRGNTALDGNPELVVARLTRALAGRPRLELESGSEELVLTWANQAEQRVSSHASALIAEVKAGMRAELDRRNGLVDRFARGG